MILNMLQVFLISEELYTQYSTAGDKGNILSPHHSSIVPSLILSLCYCLCGVYVHICSLVFSQLIETCQSVSYYIAPRYG